MKTYTIKDHDETVEVTVDYETYRTGNLAVCLTTTDGKPYATLTVNLQPLPDNLAYVDTNNCPRAPKFIEDNELGHDTGIAGYSGYCDDEAMFWISPSAKAAIYNVIENNHSVIEEKDAKEINTLMGNIKFRDVICLLAQDEDTTVYQALETMTKETLGERFDETFDKKAISRARQVCKLLSILELLGEQTNPNVFAAHALLLWRLNAPKKIIMSYAMQVDEQTEATADIEDAKSLKDKVLCILALDVEPPTQRENMWRKNG